MDQLREQDPGSPISTPTNTNNIYLIGAAGFIGSYLLQKISDSNQSVIGADLNASESLQSVDITDQSSVDQLLSELVCNDVIILPAALPNVEWVEENPIEAAAVNNYGVKKIVDHAARVNARLIFFSSDYLFDGNSGPYLENDMPNPLNIYGTQKMSSEYYISQHLENYLIIRTTGVFGYESARKNFLMSFYDRMKSGNEVKVPIDQVATPIFVEDLANITVDLASKQEIKGILNIVGSEILNRHELSLKISSAFDLDTSKLIPTPTSHLQQKANRPLLGGLNNSKLLSLGYQPGTVDQALSKIIAVHTKNL